MPTWVSRQGEFVPAKERVALTNKSDKPIKYNGETIQPGEQFIYDGPDRAALKQLHEEGTESLGHNFKEDNEFLDHVHNSRFKGDIDAYLKSVRYDEDKDKKRIEEKIAKFKAHEIPARVKAIKVMSGGRDTAGKNNFVGGFGDEQLVEDKK